MKTFLRTVCAIIAGMGRNRSHRGIPQLSSEQATFAWPVVMPSHGLIRSECLLFHRHARGQETGILFSTH